MNAYSISEWKSVTIQEKFHPTDQPIVAQLRSNDRLEIDDMKDGIRFRAKSWVGVVRFHDFQVQIVPKLAGENLGLVNMLTYAAGISALKRYNSQRFLELHQQGSLLDLIIWLFCDACEVILAGGLLFDYEAQDETLQSLRGRLLVDKQYRRRFGQIDRLECRFDEHSSNILENQILGLGLYQGGRLAHDPMIRARARKLLAIISEACMFDQVDIDAARSAVFYNRLNGHYREAHQLAWMILEGLGIEDLFKSKNTPSFAFLLDMNHLFEQFLHRYLSEVISQSKLSVAYQRRDRSIIWDIFRNRSYSQIIPDFLVSSALTTKRLAVDAKYKIYDDRKVDPSDIAQIFLYAYAYDPSPQPAAVLIYPTEEHSDKRASMMIRQSNQTSGAKIHVIGINIPEALAEIHAGKGGSSSALIADVCRQAFR